jgi:hypothetical protein
MVQPRTLHLLKQRLFVLTLPRELFETERYFIKDITNALVLALLNNSYGDQGNNNF